MIIIHHSLTKDSGTVSWQAIRKYHKSLGWNDIGYHFGCELVHGRYEILAGRPLGKKGAHCKGHNDSIGFCVVGNFDNHWVPKNQFDLSARYVAGLCDSIDEIHAHNEFSQKTCPGKMFDMHEFRALTLHYMVTK